MLAAQEGAQESEQGMRRCPLCDAQVVEDDVDAHATWGWVINRWGWHMRNHHEGWMVELRDYEIKVVRS